MRNRTAKLIFAVFCSVIIWSIYPGCSDSSSGKKKTGTGITKELLFVWSQTMWNMPPPYYFNSDNMALYSNLEIETYNNLDNRGWINTTITLENMNNLVALRDATDFFNISGHYSSPSEYVSSITCYNSNSSNTVEWSMSGGPSVPAVEDFKTALQQLFTAVRK